MFLSVIAPHRQTWLRSSRPPSAHSKTLIVISLSILRSFKSVLWKDPFVGLELAS